MQKPENKAKAHQWFMDTGESSSHLLKECSGANPGDSEGLSQVCSMVNVRCKRRYDLFIRQCFKNSMPVHADTYLCVDLIIHELGEDIGGHIPGSQHRPYD